MLGRSKTFNGKVIAYELRMFNIDGYIKKLASSVFATSAAILQIKHLVAKTFSKRTRQRHTLSFFIRTSNVGAEAERSYIFCDLSLKTFLRCS